MLNNGPCTGPVLLPGSGTLKLAITAVLKPLKQPPESIVDAQMRTHPRKPLIHVRPHVSGSSLHCTHYLT